ncbi:PPC domain-containing DNA-binding protein [Natranaerovirga pectinivora]|nr:PPC domain-containing DNA-binding protein [Natranaerovirga pectinivora]
MEYKRFNNSVVIRIDPKEEVVECIKAICDKEQIKAGSYTGLGAADEITVGLFNTKEKKYYSKTFSGDYEITSLVGSVSTMNGETYLHTHINISDVEMNVFGGHLNKAVISGTCEIVLTIIDGQVEREFNEQIGLNLYKFL